MINREFYCNSRAGAWPTFQGYPAPVGLDNLPRDVEPETEPAIVPYHD